MSDSTDNKSTDAGSYAFGHFDENQKELDRLKFQAATERELEKGMLLKAGLREGMRVLDVACGPGLVSCDIAQMVGSSGHVTGIDISPDLLIEARQVAQSRNINNVEFEQGNVYDLHLADNQYDFVYARFLFQHLEKPMEALTQILKVLKPGGVLVIVDVDDDWLTVHPSIETFDSFKRRAARSQANRGGDRFIGRKLGSLLTQAGFEDARVFVESVTSASIGMKAFLDITTGFKLEQLDQSEKADGAKEQEVIYQLISDPNAWGLVGVFVGLGIKPNA